MFLLTRIFLTFRLVPYFQLFDLLQVQSLHKNAVSGRKPRPEWLICGKKDFPSYVKRNGDIAT